MSPTDTWAVGGPNVVASTGCRALDVLWLYELADINPRRTTHAATLHSLDYSCARHRVIAWNCWHQVPSAIRKARFDVIILDANLLTIRSRFDFNECRRRLQWVGDSNAIRIALPQDEYLWTGVLEDWLLELDVDIIFSAFGATYAERLYPRLRGRIEFEHCFTGYIYSELLKSDHTAVRPHIERTTDLVYRSRRPPFSLGARAQLKHEIAIAGQRAALTAGLRHDIGTGDESTLFGAAWFKLIASSRAILGAESGAGAIDLAGEVSQLEHAMRTQNPELTFEQFAAAMPADWDGGPYFTIGPRHLEAAAAKTCQVLIEGRYDDVLEPDVHYIPVDPSFARLPDVMERIRDPMHTQAIADRAYRDIVLSGLYSYGAFAAKIERAIMPRLPSTSQGPPRGRRTMRAAAGLHDALAVRTPLRAVGLLPPATRDRIKRAARRRRERESKMDL